MIEWMGDQNLTEKDLEAMDDVNEQFQKWLDLQVMDVLPKTE